MTNSAHVLPERLSEAEASEEVDVIVLTGTDPAFCAGLDLNELGSSGSNLAGSDSSSGSSGPATRRGPFPPLTKPIIGAVNGVAITGGFELALNCDFLVAGEHAKFGDTHSRVGVMPGWGLTVLLPQAKDGVRQIRATYDRIATNTDHWDHESADGRAWRRVQFSPEKVEARRRAIQARGKQQ